MCRLTTVLTRISAIFIVAAVAVFGSFVFVSAASAQTSTLQSTYQVDPNTGQGPVTTQSQFDITNNLSGTVTDANGNLVFSGITQDVSYGGIKASSQAFIVTNQQLNIATSSFASSYGQFSDSLTIQSVSNPIGSPVQINISAFIEGTLGATGTKPDQTGNLDYAQAKVDAGFSIPFCSGPCSLLPGPTRTTGTATSVQTSLPTAFFGTTLLAEVGETFELTGFLSTSAFANTFGGALCCSNDVTPTYTGSNSASSYEDTATFAVQVLTPGDSFTSESGATYSGPAAPIPATLPLFATGLGGLGLLGWRRKRKAQATA